MTARQFAIELGRLAVDMLATGLCDDHGYALHGAWRRLGKPEIGDAAIGLLLAVEGHHTRTASADAEERATRLLAAIAKLEAEEAAECGEVRP